jgi:hypothetical protein
MTEEFRTVALVGRFKDPRVADPMRTNPAHQARSGVDTIAAPHV